MSSKTGRTEILENVIYKNLLGLVIFLPFSSWLVSLSGFIWISLVRDLLIGVIFISTLGLFIMQKKKLPSFYWVLVVFIALGLLSFFWSQVSFWQWLKGFRFMFGPIFLLLSLGLVDLERERKKNIFWVALVGGLIVTALAVLEAAGVKIPLVTRFSGVGSLVSEHRVGTTNVLRIQSVVAGPNALGLYMLSLVAYSLGVFKNIWSKFSWLAIGFSIILVMTFSRSVILGCFLMLLIYLYIVLRNKYGRSWATTMAIALLVFLFITGLFLYQRPQNRDFFTHYQSTRVRLEEYERVWSSRYEIGLFGRGMGTAGLVTQVKFDNVSNHVTENIYLDTFEQMGLIGMLLLMIIMGWMIHNSYYRADTKEGLTAFLVVLGYAFSGLFINFYTGQIGLYLMILANGLILAKARKEGLDEI